MGKLGDWSYPYIRASKAFDIANRICASPYNGEISVNGLAQELRLKERTGGFGNLVKSLKDYGLVGGRGTLRVTELAKKIAVGTAEEVSASREETFLKIPLFREINKRIGIQVPDKERFSTLLGEITKSDRLEITKRTPTIRNLYLDGCRYLKPEKKPEKEEFEVTEEREGTEIDTSLAIIEVKVGGYYQKLPYTEEGIKLAKGFLNLLENQLKAKAKPEENVPEEEG